MKIDRNLLVIFCSSLISIGLTVWFFVREKAIVYAIALTITICMSIIIFICLFWNLRIKKTQNTDADMHNKKRWQDLNKKEKICLNTIWIAALISMFTMSIALIFQLI